MFSKIHNSVQWGDNTGKVRLESILVVVSVCWNKHIYLLNLNELLNCAAMLNVVCVVRETNNVHTDSLFMAKTVKSNKHTYTIVLIVTCV